jgi:rhamnulokinase
MATRVFAAVDVGASSGRVMAGVVENQRVRLKPVHRFRNGVVERQGHLRWDIGRIHEEVRTGIALVPDAESIGIDTWGVDYGLLDADGRLVAEPVSYRDDRATKTVDRIHADVSPGELYAVAGLQFMPFNTIYQLAAERIGPLWDRAAHAVMIPDLLAYMLTGEVGSELTVASTTGLMDVCTRQWSGELLDRVGVPRALFPPIQPPGATRGYTDLGTPVTTVGSHDTASAVVALPATTDRFAYISSGTWSLVGIELDRPVLTDESRRSNFSNETGVDGRTRYLRNVGGLWLLQECLREWQRGDIEALLAAAASLPAGGPRFDVDDPALIPPGAMPARIHKAAGGRLMNEAQTVRCILDSLATAYASTVHKAGELARRTVDVIHIVGGGSQNELLCRLTADAAGLPVIAGPTEASAFGNVLVQARTAGAAPDSLEELRARLAASTPLRRYEPL